MSHSDYHTFPEPSRAAASLKNNRETGAKITRIARSWKPPNSPLDEVPAATLSRISHRLVDRETGEAYSADEFIAMIGAPPDNPALNYESETLDYLGNTGIGFSYAANLDLLIKGLKAIDAWIDCSMWILDNRYQGAGTAVIGTGGTPINGIKENGLGIITESDEEYYFSRGTARVWTPTVLMPTSPLMSLMMVGKLPIQNSNYGAMFGGRTGFASINSQSSFTSLALGDGAISGRVASHVFSNAAQAVYVPPTPTPTPRACYLMSVTGETSGNCSVNGGTLVSSSIPTGGSGYATAADYTDIPLDTQASIWGPGDNSIQSTSPGAASFVAFWRTNQSAKAASIYSLYKSTIGSHLDLP